MKLRVTFKRSEAMKHAGRVAVVLAWVVAGGALVGTVFGVSFFMAMRVEMRSTEVSVPDLAGMTLEAASASVEPVELVLAVAEQRHDPAVPSGRVLQQTPPAGSDVRRGRKIKLVLSLGGKVLEVPDLVGQASRAVEIELRQQEFVPGDQARAFSTYAPSGDVIAQVPPKETPAVPGTRVHRLVSEGSPPLVWVMPDLTGLPRDDVERWIGRST
jgi:serine/threonine-protein kinase